MGISGINPFHVSLEERDILNSMIVHQVHELLVGSALVLQQDVGLQLLDVEFVMPKCLCLAEEAEWRCIKGVSDCFSHRVFNCSISSHDHACIRCYSVSCWLSNWIADLHLCSKVSLFVQVISQSIQSFGQSVDNDTEPVPPEVLLWWMICVAGLLFPPVVLQCCFIANGDVQAILVDRLLPLHSINGNSLHLHWMTFSCDVMS